MGPMSYIVAPGCRGGYANVAEWGFTAPLPQRLAGLDSQPDGFYEMNL